MRLLARCGSAPLLPLAPLSPTLPPAHPRTLFATLTLAPGSPRLHTSVLSTDCAQAGCVPLLWMPWLPVRLHSCCRPARFTPPCSRRPPACLVPFPCPHHYCTEPRPSGYSLLQTTAPSPAHATHPHLCRYYEPQPPCKMSPGLQGAGGAEGRMRQGRNKRGGACRAHAAERQQGNKVWGADRVGGGAGSFIRLVCVGQQAGRKGRSSRQPLYKGGEPQQPHGLQREGQGGTATGTHEGPCGGGGAWQPSADVFSGTRASWARRANAYAWRNARRHGAAQRRRGRSPLSARPPWPALRSSSAAGAGRRPLPPLPGATRRPGRPRCRDQKKWGDGGLSLIHISEPTRQP